MKEIVPFSEAKLEAHNRTFEVRCINLPGGRVVEVGVAKDGFRLFTIERPTLDGKTSQLKFGLSEEAAYALGVLLTEGFENR